MRAAVGLAFVTVLVACGSDGPSADEARVCQAIQGIVDDLGHGRSQAAIDGLTTLKAAVDATTNRTLADAGRRFMSDLFVDVDPMQVTMNEGANLGRVYSSKLVAELDAMVGECADVGSRIERLPT